MGLSSQEGRLNPIESKVAPEKKQKPKLHCEPVFRQGPVHPIEYKLNPI